MSKHKTIIKATVPAPVAVSVVTTGDVVERLVHLNPGEKIIFRSEDGKHFAESQRHGFSNTIVIKVDGRYQKTVAQLQKSLASHIWQMASNN